MITELLAILSIAAATGLRVALPLLIIGLMSGQALWSNVPVLSGLPPALLLGILASWSAAELMLLKERHSQRVFQLTELVLSPGVGALAGVAIARTLGLTGSLNVVIALISALLALVLQLLQVGWFYRAKRPPQWVLFGVDGLCIVLALFAFDAPRQGGLIALLLLWLVIRTSYTWRAWPQESNRPPTARSQGTSLRR
ncbi:MAG: DUF4126 domain-containing protein [Leptolyngbyaceae cyanobacterium SM2_5_2]|nr:DUF4126 domain-containing protein [Leptolyngbyaceae cyanobacterium SM2_5_2]